MDRQQAKTRERYRTDPEYRERYKALRLSWVATRKDGKVVTERVDITPESYLAMHEAQDGRCAICRQPETVLSRGVPKRLAIDHEHGTGYVRALLCTRCNTALGLLNDDPARLELAAAYLRSHARSEEPQRREALERLGRAVG